MKQRIKLSKWAKLNSYSYRGAFNLYQNDQIPGAFKNATGTILVELDEKTDNKANYTVVYTRVSSSENKKNLDTQAQRIKDYCFANGWIVNDVVKECASGINDTRPKLDKILNNKKITRIVVEHKDRLTRFGFNYIKTLFDGEIVVINETKTDEQDLMQDFVSIITSFCARIYGKRRSNRKTTKIIKELTND